MQARRTAEIVASENGLADLPQRHQALRIRRSSPTGRRDGSCWAAGRVSFARDRLRL